MNNAALSKQYKTERTYKTSAKLKTQNLDQSKKADRSLNQIKNLQRTYQIGMCNIKQKINDVSKVQIANECCASHSTEERNNANQDLTAANQKPNHDGHRR